MAEDMVVRPVQPGDVAEWLRLRLVLWPDGDRQQYADDIAAFLAGNPQPTLQAAFVAHFEQGDEENKERHCGLVEVSIRPYADGCETDHVGYLEGWVVDAAMRGRGVGRALVEAAEAWARAQGCTEMASDTELDNIISQAAHQRLGYAEAGRVVQFAKRL